MTDVKRRDEIQGEIIHEYDGIEEADNALPKWWLWALYASVIFAVGYWFLWETYGIEPSAMAVYEEEEAAIRAKAALPATDEQLVGLAQNPLVVANGKDIYVENCSVCHADDGSGRIGPNLTDGFWIQGGAPTNIYKSIKDGVLAKGMPAWIGPLGPTGTREVAAFVISIQDTNLPGKEPQGDPWP